MSCYDIALREARQVWIRHHFGAPSTAVVDDVYNVTVDAMQQRERNIVVPLHYAMATARNRAARLAEQEHVRQERLAALHSECLRMQAVMPNVESLVDARLRLARVTRIGSALPQEDKAIIGRLIDGTTTSEDRNGVRRLRRVLEG